MKKFLCRRSFLETSSKLALVSSAIPFLLEAKHHKNPRFTLGLSQYSLRALLRNGSLDHLTSQNLPLMNLELKAIDLWEGGLPKDKLDDLKYLATMRKKQIRQELIYFF